MITKAAYDPDALTNNLLFTKSARDAWKLILNSVKVQKEFSSVLLPAYIGFTDREGSGIFDPVENTETPFGFYTVNEDLSIDYNNLVRQLSEGSYNVLLVVHYFGICRNDLKKIKELCNNNNVILVEDCAHAFHIGQPNEGLGTEGDLSFYSVHKYLPVTSGGILKNISNKIKLLPIPDIDKMEESILLQLVKSKNILIAEKRRLNFTIYENLLAGMKGIEIMYNLTENEIPQSFPIKVKNKQREPLYFFLMDRNLPTTALYYRLIEQLTPEKYPISNQIAAEILNLPVHQDISEDDIHELVDAINLFFTENQ